MNLRFTGLRTAVTGDAAGIGRAIADRLAAGGAQLAYCTLHAGDAAMAVQALSEHGSYVTVTTADLGSGASLARWLNAAAGDFGRLDLVVCSIGPGPDAPLLPLLQAARPHLLQGTAKAFFVVGADAARLQALAPEAAGLALHALPADATAADELLRLISPR